MEECTFKPNLMANNKSYFARTSQSAERSKSNTRSLKEFLRD